MLKETIQIALLKTLIEVTKNEFPEGNTDKEAKIIEFAVDSVENDELVTEATEEIKEFLKDKLKSLKEARKIIKYERNN